jgi:hypothetical protein
MILISFNKIIKIKKTDRHVIISFESIKLVCNRIDEMNKIEFQLAEIQFRNSHFFGPIERLGPFLKFLLKLYE